MKNVFKVEEIYPLCYKVAVKISDKLIKLN